MALEALLYNLLVLGSVGSARVIKRQTKATAKHHLAKL